MSGSVDVADSSPSTPKPCNGPNCKQSEELPLPTPAPPTSERHHYDVACVMRQSSEMDTFDARVFAELRLVLPTGNPLGIERPPQF